MRSSNGIWALRQRGQKDEEGSNGNGNTGTERETNSNSGNSQDTSIEAQWSTTSRKDCEDQDDDECHTSTTSTSSERSTVTLTTTLPPTPLVPLPSLPPTPTAATTLQSITSTTSKISSTPPVVASTRTISTITSFSTQFTASTALTSTPSIAPSTGSQSSSSTTSSTAVFNAQPALSSQTASNSGISSVGAQGSQAGVVVAILVGTLIAVVGLIFFIRRSFRRLRDRNLGSSPPSSPIARPSLSQSRNSNGWVDDTEQYRPRNPSQSLPSTTKSPTVATGEIFPATAVPTMASPGLSNNPIGSNILQPDGTVKTIIKPNPFQIAKEDDISEKRLTSKVQQTDIYIQEKTGVEAFPEEWPEKLNKQPPPLAFDMLGVDENGNAEKKKTLLLERKAGGRWSDPFTVAWRGSLEAEGGGTRWKSARSWVKEQNGRLKNPDVEEI